MAVRPCGRSPAFLQVTPTPSKDGLKWSRGCHVQEVSSASRLLKWRASVKSSLAVWWVGHVGPNLKILKKAEL